MTRSTARTRARRLGAVCVLIPGLVSMWVGGAAGQTRHEDIEATFLYNFAKFVEWPESSPRETAAAFRIEIMGRDPFDGRFDQLMIGKQIQNRSIEVVHSLAAPSATPVQVAFVSASEAKRLQALLDSYRPNRVLTVSDMAEFTRLGGMIEFVKNLGTVRFRINQAAVEQSQLRVSSRLLALGLPPPPTAGP